MIISEIGGDMSRFATSRHLASWAGQCPGNDQSAGKRRSGKTRDGSKWLDWTLEEVALAAPARSYASRISITSSAFFKGRPPPRLRARRRWIADRSRRSSGEIRGRPRGEKVAINGDFRWPPTGRFPWPPSSSSPERYADTGLGLADACLVALAERLWRERRGQATSHVRRARVPPPPGAAVSAAADTDASTSCGAD